jgi:transposase
MPSDRERREAKVRRNLAFEMRQAGAKYKDIAAHFGVSATRAAQLCDRARRERLAKEFERNRPLAALS